MHIISPWAHTTLVMTLGSWTRRKTELKRETEQNRSRKRTRLPKSDAPLALPWSVQRVLEVRSPRLEPKRAWTQQPTEVRELASKQSEVCCCFEVCMVWMLTPKCVASMAIWSALLVLKCVGKPTHNQDATWQPTKHLKITIKPIQVCFHVIPRSKFQAPMRLLQYLTRNHEP